MLPELLEATWHLLESNCTSYQWKYKLSIKHLFLLGRITMEYLKVVRGQIKQCFCASLCACILVVQLESILNYLVQARCLDWESEIHLFLSFVVFEIWALKLSNQKWPGIHLGRTWQGVNNNVIFTPLVIMIFQSLGCVCQLYMLILYIVLLF